MRVYWNSELYVLSLLFHMGIGISFRPVLVADTTQFIRYSHMGPEQVTSFFLLLCFTISCSQWLYCLLRTPRESRLTYHKLMVKKKRKRGVPLLQQSLFRTLKKRSVQTLNFISLLFYIISFAIFLYDIFCFYSHWHFRRKYFSS